MNKCYHSKFVPICIFIFREFWFWVRALNPSYLPSINSPNSTAPISYRLSFSLLLIILFFLLPVFLPCFSFYSLAPKTTTTTTTTTLFMPSLHLLLRQELASTSPAHRPPWVQKRDLDLDAAPLRSFSAAASCSPRRREREQKRAGRGGRGRPLPLVGRR